MLAHAPNTHVGHCTVNAVGDARVIFDSDLEPLIKTGGPYDVVAGKPFAYGGYDGATLRGDVGVVVLKTPYTKTTKYASVSISIKS